MKLASLTLTLLSCLSLAVSPAYAQDKKTGSRFKEDRFSAQEGRARLALDFYGECVARIKADEFVAYMRDPSNETWKAVTYFPNHTTRCVNQDMQASSRTVQGAIAEGWYLFVYPDGLPPALASFAPRLPPQEPAIAEILAASEQMRPFIIVDEFARCVVAANPVKSDAFLRTHVGEDDEKRAFAQLSPNLGQCAFEGQKLSFNMTGFRGALAYAMAELALNPTMHDVQTGAD